MKDTVWTFFPLTTLQGALRVAITKAAYSTVQPSFAVLTGGS